MHSHYKATAEAIRKSGVIEMENWFTVSEHDILPDDQPFTDEDFEDAVAWAFQDNPLGQEDVEETPIFTEGFCNTCGCIAGYSFVVAGGKDLEKFNYVEEGKRLGLSRVQAEFLFHVNNWDNDWRVKYEKADTMRERATVVADYMEGPFWEKLQNPEAFWDFDY